jgi:hypothetical protein
VEACPDSMAAVLKLLLPGMECPIILYTPYVKIRKEISGWEV